MTPDRLNAHLLEIENDLGGSGELPPAYLEDKLHWHLCKIEELINGGGGGGGSISFVIVNKLPETGEKNIIYLVPKKTIFSRNKYDEYVWINDDFEYIGTGAFDPTGYATVEYVDTELLKKQNKLDFNIEEVPATAKTLTSIKDGENVYVIPHSGATVEWSDIANKPDFQEVSFTADYSDLINTPTIPTDTSDLTNGAGFITSSALSGYATEQWVGNQGYITNSALSGYATEQWVSNQGYSTFSGSYDDLTDKPTLFSGAYDDLTGKPDLSIYAESADLSTVATTGDYDDLENKPDIPENTSDLNNDSGFITGVAWGDITGTLSSQTDLATELDKKAETKTFTPTSITVHSFDPLNVSLQLSSADCADIFEHKYNLITLITRNVLQIDLTLMRQADNDRVVGYITQIDTGEQVYYYSMSLSNSAVYENLFKRIDNIPLAKVATTGSYNDLTDKPDLFDGDYDSLTNKPDLTVYEEKENLKDCAYMDENELEINYNQLTNTPSIPENTSDLTNDSGFITADYHDSTKQDTLVSGTSIKTINGESLLGSGNLDKRTITLLVDQATGNVTMSQDDIDYLYTYRPSDVYVITPIAEGVTATQVYELVGSTVVADYNVNSLVYKTLDTSDSEFVTSTVVAIPHSASDPVVPIEQELALHSDIPAAQVNSDWEAASGVAQILNKPTLATVATSGSYADLSNTPLSSISISQTTTPGTASHPASATTTITLDGTSTTINTFTTIDSALSSSSKNPVANDAIYNAISNKVEAEDFQELEKITLTTNGILSGTPLVPVLSITDGVYYPTVSDNNQRWKMGKADRPTFYKIYDVSQYTSVHLKSVSRAGHILTNTAPSDFNVYMHQESPATWYEAADVSNSEQADVLPKTGFTPYDKELTTNGKHYLIVYEVNAAQAIEVINGGGYSPIYTSMFVNDGDGTTQNDSYAKISDITTPTFTATTFNPDSAITFSQEDLADIYENQYDIIKVVAEILPNVFFNLSFRKTADTAASGLTSVKYDYTTCTNSDTLEEIGFQVFNSSGTYSTTPYHLQLQNSPVTDVQTTGGTSIVSNKIATIPALYQHAIHMTIGTGDGSQVFFTLVTPTAEAFTAGSIISYLNNNFAQSARIAASGTIYVSANHRFVACVAPGENSTEIRIWGALSTGGLSNSARVITASDITMNDCAVRIL